MKWRRVFSTRDVSHARQAIAAVRESGIPDQDVSLIARSDIELEQIPDDKKQASTDFVPASLRGAGYGGAAGMLAGMVAVTIFPLGVTLAGAMLGGLAAGALIGSWSSALMGSALPDPIRRKFEDEIDAGHVLLVIDSDDEHHQKIAPTLGALGAIQLEYDAPAAAS